MRITPKQYAQTLHDLTDGKSKSEIEKSIFDFARYLHRERKLKLAEKIIEQFGKIYNEKNGIVEAEVESWKKLDEAEMKKVKHFLKENYDAKEVNMKKIVNENIKGGIIIRVGDEVLDGSVAGRISQLKKLLVS